MSTVASVRSNRWAVWLILVPLLLVAGLGLGMVAKGWMVLRELGFWGDARVAYDTPVQVASVAVPARANSLVWSADGRYVAAGTWGRATGEAVGGEVYVVDVAKSAVHTTLKVNSWVEGLAFSPDGRWLAVATRPPSSPPAAAGATDAALVVFDVPAFTAKITAPVQNPASGFVDLAWTADSRSLLAIEGPVDNAGGQASIRRWDVAAAAEQPAVSSLEVKGDVALAVSESGRTVAVAYGDGEQSVALLRLLDASSGAERSMLRTGDTFSCPRLGFTTDGKAIGVFDSSRLKLSWWDVAGGKRVELAGRFALQPAGLAEQRGRASVSPDGEWMAAGFDRHRGFGDLGWDNRGEEFGGFVQVTNSRTGETWMWRVSKAQEPPGAVAISPDGKRIAGTIGQISGGAVVIWETPK